MFDEEIIILSPPKPITEYIYKCDKRFHLENIIPLYQSYETFGLVIVSGTGSEYFTLSGTEIRKISSKSVKLPKSQRKGGQSAPRFGRLRDEAISNYINNVSDGCTRLYVEDDLPIIKGLVIAGLGDKKDLVYNKLHPKLKLISTVITVTEKDTVYSIKDQLQDIFDEINNTEDNVELEEFFEHLNNDTGRAIYGPRIIEEHMKNCLLEKIIIHQSLIDSGFNIDKLRDKCDKNGCTVIIIQDINTALVDGYGGIVGISWY